MIPTLDKNVDEDADADAEAETEADTDADVDVRCRKETFGADWQNYMKRHTRRMEINWATVQCLASVNRQRWTPFHPSANSSSQIDYRYRRYSRYC